MTNTTHTCKLCGAQLTSHQYPHHKCPVMTADELGILIFALNRRNMGPEANEETVRFFTVEAKRDALEYARDTYLNEAGIAVANSALAKLSA